MPDMDGIELLRAVRIKWPEMKIVVMSGELMWLEASYKLGADATLEKPLSNAVLWTIVSSFLGES